MSWVCCLLKSKKTYQGAEKLSHRERRGRRQKGGKEQRWHRLWDRERERERKRERDIRNDRRSERLRCGGGGHVLKWGETFEDQQVNHSFDNCVVGSSLWGSATLFVILCVCVCVYAVCLHVSFTHYNLRRITTTLSRRKSLLLVVKNTKEDFYEQSNELHKRSQTRRFRFSLTIGTSWGDVMH